MARYRKVVEYVEAVQWRSGVEVEGVVPGWECFHVARKSGHPLVRVQAGRGKCEHCHEVFVVETTGKPIKLDEGDWIITRQLGGRVVMPDEVFRVIFEPVEAGDPSPTAPPDAEEQP